MESKNNVKNKHMQVVINEETQRLEYKYKFVSGVSKIKGGTFVLRDLDYPEEIVESAIQTLDKL